MDSSINPRKYSNDTLTYKSNLNKNEKNIQKRKQSILQSTKENKSYETVLDEVSNHSLIKEIFKDTQSHNSCNLCDKNSDSSNTIIKKLSCHRICTHCIFTFSLSKFYKIHKDNSQLHSIDCDEDVFENLLKTFELECPICNINIENHNKQDLSIVKRESNITLLKRKTTLSIDKKNSRISSLLSKDKIPKSNANDKYLSFYQFLEEETIFQKSTINTDDKCECCQEMAIEFFCLNCNIYYCYKCILNHNQNKKFLYHTISSNIENINTLNICRCNKNRRIEFFCLSCDDYFCINCIFIRHFSHNYYSDFSKSDELLALKKDLQIEDNCNEKDINETMADIYIKTENTESKYNINHSKKETFTSNFSLNDTKKSKDNLIFQNNNIKALLENKQIKYSEYLSNEELNCLKSVLSNWKYPYISLLDESCSIENSSCMFLQNLLNLFDSQAFMNQFNSPIYDMSIFHYIKIRITKEFEDLIHYYKELYKSLNKNIKLLINKTQNSKLLLNSAKYLVENSIRINKMNIRSFPCISVNFVSECIQNKIRKLNILNENNVNYGLDFIYNSPKAVAYKKVKTIFKGQMIRKLNSEVVLKNSHLSDDSNPNMFIVFKNNYGKCIIAYYNNKNYSIEIFDFTKLKKNESEIKDNQSILSRNITLNTSFSKNKKHIKNKNSQKEILSSIFESPTKEERTKRKLNNNDNKSILSHKTFKVTKSVNSITNLLDSSNIFNIKTNKSLKLQQENSIKIIKGHTDIIYSIRHFSIDRENYILTTSKDNTCRIWDELYFSDILCINNTVNVRSGVIFKYSNDKLIALCSYTKNFPINIFNFKGLLIKQIPITGYSYHIDVFQNKTTYIFISTYPYVFSIINYGTGEILYSYNTSNYINSIICNFPLVFILDRNGSITQINIRDGEIEREYHNVGYYGMCRWNERYYVVCGKGLGLDIVDINNFNFIDSINGLDCLHSNSIRSVNKFRHPNYGDVLLTYGEDHTIRIHK